MRRWGSGGTRFVKARRSWGARVVGREEHDKLRSLQAEIERRTGGERAVGRVLGSVLYNALVLTIFA